MSLLPNNNNNILPPGPKGIPVYRRGALLLYRGMWGAPRSYIRSPEPDDACLTARAPLRLHSTVFTNSPRPSIAMETRSPDWRVKALSGTIPVPVSR